MVDLQQYVSGLLHRCLGTWWLSGETLGRFIVDRCVSGPVIEVTTTEPPSHFAARFRAMEFQEDVNGDWFNERLAVALRIETIERPLVGIEVLSLDQIEAFRHYRQDVNRKGLWEFALDGRDEVTFCLPFRMGRVADEEAPGWWRRRTKVHTWVGVEEFFTPERAVEADRTLVACYECARRAGFADRVLIGYGTLLGLIRDGTYIPWDRDLDLIILADDLSAAQTDAYLDECRRAGLCETRLHGPERRSDTGAILWFSLGAKSPYHHNGIKCCQWFSFHHDDYLFHSKGQLWIDTNKFDPHIFAYNNSDEAVCKGVDAAPFATLSEWTPRPGVSVLVPAYPGAALDLWYPGWFARQGGASAKSCVLAIPRWAHPEGWHYA